MTFIIGITGRARHGKTTAAEAIGSYCDETGIDSKLYSISDEVIAYCEENDLLPHNDRESMNGEELKILVAVGQEKVDEDPDFWLSRVLEKIEIEAPSVAIIHNVRLKYEACRIQDLKGFVLRTFRLNEDNTPFYSKDRDPDVRLETESELICADDVVVSYSNKLSPFKRRVVATVAPLLGAKPAKGTASDDDEDIDVVLEQSKLGGNISKNKSFFPLISYIEKLPDGRVVRGYAKLARILKLNINTVAGYFSNDRLPEYSEKVNGSWVIGNKRTIKELRRKLA